MFSFNNLSLKGHYQLQTIFVVMLIMPILKIGKYGSYNEEFIYFICFTKILNLKSYHYAHSAYEEE